MLHNLNWLVEGASFPPVSEVDRITSYNQSKQMFASEHWSAQPGSPYYSYVERITRVVGNFEKFLSFPVLLNYQRLMTLKTADLVCGEYPIITGKDTAQNEVLKEMREGIDLDTKLYASVLDLVMFGDSIWRVYKDIKTEKYCYTLWDICDWFPIVSQDGTFTIEQNVIAWIETLGTAGNETFKLHVQIHKDGEYEYRVYAISPPAIISNSNVARPINIDGSLNPSMVYTTSRTIGKILTAPITVKTGIEGNAIVHVRNMSVSGTVFGFDDYTPIDSLVAEAMTRLAQIALILDKHADPSMTGPASMLKQDPKTGQLYFQAGDFYGTNPGDNAPEYLTWDGNLESAFKQLEFIINQLYIISEMGSALLGAGGSESGQAISGTAMRFKMVNPLAKARRISNLMTIPVKQLLATISKFGYTEIEQKDISIIWQDGLPDDPRETMELVKLATGATKIVPLKTAIEEMLKRTPEEADRWNTELEDAANKEMQRTIDLTKAKSTEPDGSYKKTGSSQEKGSSLSTTNADSQRKDSAKE